MDELLEVRLRLQGVRQFVAESAAAAKGVAGFGLASEEAAAKTRLSNLEMRAMQQGMYTLRRYVFWGTTAVLGFAAASLKLGLSFDEAKTSGTQAFTALLGGTTAANQEMRTLIGLTHRTGVQLETFTSAAVQMQGFGFTIREVNTDLAALASFAQRSGRGGAGLGALVEVFDRIRQSGRLTSLDLRTLNAQGISGVQILTRQLGLTEQQAQALRRGRLVIPSSLALPALATGIGARANQLGTNLGQQVGIAHSFLSSLLGGGEQGIFAFATRGLERINAAFAARTKGGSFLNSLDPSGKLLGDWKALTSILTGVAGGFTLVWRFGSATLSVFRPLIAGTAGLLHHVGLLGFALHSLSNVLATLTALYLLDRTRLVAVMAAQKLFAGVTLFTTGSLKKQTVATKEADAAALGLRGSLLGLRKLSPLTLLLLLSLVPKAKPNPDPSAPSNNPVAKWFSSIPGVGGIFSQANRAADWADRQLGLLPAPGATMHSSRLQPVPHFFPHQLPGVGAAGQGTTVVLNVDGEELARANVKSTGQRRIYANAVLQEQGAAAARR